MGTAGAQSSPQCCDVSSPGHHAHALRARQPRVCSPLPVLNCALPRICPQVVERRRTPAEIREEFERLQREREERRLQQRTNPKVSLPPTPPRHGCRAGRPALVVPGSHSPGAGGVRQWSRAKLNQSRGFPRSQGDRTQRRLALRHFPRPSRPEPRRVEIWWRTVSPRDCLHPQPSTH